MPDLVPNRQNSIRINGGYGGPGVTYTNFSKTAYLDTSAFQTLNYYPVTPITKIGDSPRSSLNLWGPSHYNLDASLPRSFRLSPERSSIHKSGSDSTTKAGIGGPRNAN